MYTGNEPISQAVKQRVADLKRKNGEKSLDFDCLGE